MSVSIVPDEDPTATLMRQRSSSRIVESSAKGYTISRGLHHTRGGSMAVKDGVGAPFRIIEKIVDRSHPSFLEYRTFLA